MKADEILKKHEDANEMHFYQADRKWIIEAMEEYAALRQPPVISCVCPNEIKTGTVSTCLAAVINCKNTDMKRILGFTCLIWAVIFGHLETKYFGNNWLPQTNEEILCDITSLLLCIAGSVLLWQKRK